MRPAKHLRKNHPQYGVARRALSKIFARCKASCPGLSLPLSSYYHTPTYAHRTFHVISPTEAQRLTKHTFEAELRSWLTNCSTNHPTAFLDDRARLDKVAALINSYPDVKSFIAEKNRKVS